MARLSTHREPDVLLRGRAVAFADPGRFDCRYRRAKFGTVAAGRAV
jgi:hypothetical protein